MELCAASVSRTVRGFRNCNYRPSSLQPVVSFEPVCLCVCVFLCVYLNGLFRYHILFSKPKKQHTSNSSKGIFI